MKVRHLTAGALCLVAAAPSARFQPWTDFPEASFRGTRLWRDAITGAYCFVTDHSRVDADGAPNAYHPADKGRRTPPYLGLDNPANAGWPKSSWWGNVLARDPADPSKAYRQRSGVYKGFFVAQTTLRVKGGNPREPATYVDSTAIPYAVLPGSTFPRLKGTGAAGDVGMAWNLANGRSTAFVIGDTGGGREAQLGEGSIALFKALGGQNPDARTGTGVAPGKMRFVLFPGSRRALGWPASLTAITDLANHLLEDVGGKDALSTCVE